tara:strand:- start:14567 stop:15454 length:888 start_codon:yes stop_codon:yes gene_type:complete
MINVKFVISLFLLSISFLQGNTGLLQYNSKLHGPFPFVINQSNIDSISTSKESSIYPARGLALSLVIPGMGQWYAGAKAKAFFFFGLEVAGWMSFRSFSNKGEKIEREYEKFADENWDLYEWWLRTPWLTSSYGDVVCKGTHHLNLFLPGQTTTISSDSLCGEWIEGVEVVKDHEFYENVGKYDQFVAGWSDLFLIEGENGWWEKEKSVGDSTEIIVMTDLKRDYINQRAKANNAFRMGTFTVTALMFNHLISAFDAFIETRRRKISSESQTNIGLLFSPYARLGIGGFSLSVRW